MWLRVWERRVERAIVRRGCIERLGDWFGVDMVGLGLLLLGELGCSGGLWVECMVRLKLWVIVRSKWWVMVVLCDKAEAVGL